MENLHLQEHLQGLHKLTEHYEEQLRLIGFDMRELPEELIEILEECVEIQKSTHIQDLSLDNLEVYYYSKRGEILEFELKLARLNAELVEQEAELQSLTSECDVLEKFLESVNQRLISTTEIQRTKAMYATKTKALQDRQNSLNIPQDVNIDQLVRNVEELQLHKQKPKKS